MTSVEAIEKEIERLSSSELSELRRWFEEFESNAWDMQIEKDAQAGKLDYLAEAALREYHAGKAREL
jgi:hypothetical protein